MISEPEPYKVDRTQIDVKDQVKAPVLPPKKPI